MKKRSFVSNVIYSSLYEMVVLLIPLITTPYISRVLGPENIGNYSFVVGIVSYFGIVAALGTINYASREIAFRQSHLYKRTIAFYEILIFRTICTSVVMLLYLYFIFCVTNKYRVLYIIQITTVLSWVFDISWFYHGLEDFKIITIRNTTVRLAGTILIFLLVKKPEDLGRYALILGASNLVGNIFSWIGLKKYLVPVKKRDIKIFSHFKGSLQFFAATVAVQIYTVFDSTMLGVMKNTTEVGYYSQSQKVIKLCLTLISSFVLVLVPRIAVLFSENNKKEMNRYFHLSLDYLFMISLPMMVGCILCSDSFVPIFFGRGYEPVAVLMKMLSLLFVILGLGQLTGNLLSAVNRQMKSTISVCVGAVCNFILNLILIPQFASVGAVMASVISECIVTILEIKYIRDVLDVTYIRKALYKYLLPTCIMIGVILGVRVFDLSLYASLIVQVLSGIASYFLVLYIKKDNLILQIVERILKRL